LKETVENCKVGASVRDLCIKADQRLEEETGKAFKKDKKLLKGMKAQGRIRKISAFSIT
jgi:hypothetical protein